MNPDLLELFKELISAMIYARECEIQNAINGRFGDYSNAELRVETLLEEIINFKENAK